MWFLVWNLWLTCPEDCFKELWEEFLFPECCSLSDLSPVWYSHIIKRTALTNDLRDGKTDRDVLQQWTTYEIALCVCIAVDLCTLCYLVVSVRRHPDVWESVCRFFVQKNSYCPGRNQHNMQLWDIQKNYNNIKRQEIPIHLRVAPAQSVNALFPQGSFWFHPDLHLVPFDSPELLIPSDSTLVTPTGSASIFNAPAVLRSSELVMSPWYLITRSLPWSQPTWRHVGFPFPGSALVHTPEVPSVLLHNNVPPPNFVIAN